MFSIIIPVYNCSNSLHVSVESIINQDYSDWELILVNDGSKDDSLSICHEFSKKDTRIRVIDQINMGAGPARNNGIKHAKGEYILFCDADDFYEKNALMVFHNAIVNYNKPDLIISSYKEYKYEESNIKICREIELDKEILFDKKKIRNEYLFYHKKGVITAPWCKAYKKSLLDDSKILFPQLKRCQDVVFNIQYYDCISSLVVISDKTYNYQTPDNGTYLKKFPINMFEINKIVYKIIIEKLKLWNAYSDEAKKYLASRFNKDNLILLRLNYQNNWSLDKKNQIELSKKILKDSITKEMSEIRPIGTMNRVIRLILKTKSITLVNFFSWGTLKYQERRNVK